ncbi:MAG TPA: hypothetical protein VH418_19365 [Solirubrobacteraceae bacterium]|jgi:hypothetical protein
MTRTRHFICAAVLLATLAALPAAAASARTTRTCTSSDLRYAFMPGQPKFFGVHKLRVTGGRCATAHRVAKRWMTRFEANLKRGSDALPRHVRGFTFKQVPVKASQTFGLRGTRGQTIIRFNYVVPNG